MNFGRLLKPLASLLITAVAQAAITAASAVLAKGKARKDGA